MNNKKFIIFTFLVSTIITGYSEKLPENYPDPVTNPGSPVMLAGEWFEHPHEIDFDRLPRIPSEHSVVSDVRADGINQRSFSDAVHSGGGVNQHSYLIYYDGKFWVMWSDGPGVEDRVGQVVKYATSPDGVTWTDPEFLTPYPPDSGPDSPHYNTRTNEGFRWISRGFWQRDGELFALASLDEAAGFFGPGLELRAFRWNREEGAWEDFGLVQDNAINNFPPKRLPTSEWMMSRRRHDYSTRGVEFITGGVEAIDQWESFPVLGSESELAAEEPYWWILPDGKSLMALFRDNRRSGYLYRSFSIDNGRNWSRPVQTDFPDARSKFNGLRLSDGRYVLVSNPDPKKRDPLTISISDDGMVFTKMGYLVGGRHIDYPHVIEHDGFLYIAFAGSAKQMIEVLKIRISELDSVFSNFSDQAVSPSEVKTNSVGMELVKINPGSFIMGSEEGEYDEKPVSKINISNPFYMSSTPVTNVQYEQFDPHHRMLRGKRGLSSEDDEAAVYVSWYDAVAFTEWLSIKEGKPYRLPTEAEWEYACRAGTETPYNTGDSLPVIYHLNQKNEWYPKEVPLTVGKTPPNQWGLYNMHGLVEEWCLDWYGPYTGDELTNPFAYHDSDFRVTRGGSHNTDPVFLRSANRMGMIPENKHFLTGFRVVQAEMPAKLTVESKDPEKWAEQVSQSPSAWTSPVNMTEPYFSEPIYFQKIPSGSEGPLYSQHNHCPDITPLPNGDLFATWYTTITEQGRELAVAASRLRSGSHEWDEPDLFYKVPDRNMHATSILWDRSGDRIYHFQGMAVSYGWGDLALFMRTSEDNGVTWSKPHWINHEHGLRNMPIAGAFKTSNGAIIVPCDAVTGMEGGSAIHISTDDGITWNDPGAGTPRPEFDEGKTGGTIAGIHAGLVELKDGSLMALGRGNNINGYMPMSISEDMGRSWTYSASPFPPIGGGQRLVLMRLNEGPLFFASFTGLHDDEKGMEFADIEGNKYTGYGLFVALSYDEGKTWSTRKLVTPGEGEFDGGAWTREFVTDDTRAEPRGYLAATQSPDNVIHLISSRLHYRFNLAWIEE